jgi:hypothetical protein
MKGLLKIIKLAYQKVVFLTFSIIFLFALHTKSQTLSFDNQVNSFTTHCRIENNKLVVEHTYEFQVNNKKGDWITEILIPYSTKEPVKNIEAWISDKHGNVFRNLKKRDIVEKNMIEDGTLYQDNFFKTFSLRHNVYPYTIHYSYQQVFNEFVIIDYWTPTLFRKTPTLDANLIVEVPVDYGLHILQNAINEPSLDTVDDKLIYKWAGSSLISFEAETMSPPRSELISKVYIVPEQFNYGTTGNFSSWKTYGNWQCELNKGTDDLPEIEKIKVKNLTNGIEDPIEKARILYHYLQDNTRYINVAIDIGGLKPYPASYVAEKKYGDCKALSNYLKTLLDEAGISSYYTKVYAEINPRRIDTSFIGPQFNHIILFIPNGNDTIWLETTNRYSPFGYLGTYTQNRNAFAIIENESQLVRTPSLTFEDVAEKRIVHVELEEGNAVLMKFEEILRGKEFERLNSLYHEYSEYEQKRIIPKYFIPLKSFELKDWQINQKSRDEPEITLDFTVKVENFIKQYDESQLLNILPTRLPDLEKPENRKYPVRVNYPLNKKDSLVYQIDTSGYRKIIIPKDDTISSLFGRYIINAELLTNQVVVHKSFQLYRGDYGLDKYAVLYDFIKAIRKKERKLAIVLKNKK